MAENKDYNCASDISGLNKNHLKFLSYNMHGFNQGWPTIAELIDQFDFIVILLQEHWLTPTNLIKFDELFNEYFTFGSSAMAEALESDTLRGRPFGS